MPMPSQATGSTSSRVDRAVFLMAPPRGRVAARGTRSREQGRRRRCASTSSAKVTIADSTMRTCAVGVVARPAVRDLEGPPLQYADVAASCRSVPEVGDHSRDRGQPEQARPALPGTAVGEVAGEARGLGDAARSLGGAERARRLRGTARRLAAPVRAARGLRPGPRAARFLRTRRAGPPCGASPTGHPAEQHRIADPAAGVDLQHGALGVGQDRDQAGRPVANQPGAGQQADPGQRLDVVHQRRPAVHAAYGRRTPAGTRAAPGRRTVRGPLRWTRR